MATYRQIIEHVRRSAGFVAQSSWIADVKSSHGLTRGPAHNRIHPGRKVTYCPPDKRKAIEQALIHFGMI